MLDERPYTVACAIGEEDVRVARSERAEGDRISGVLGILSGVRDAGADGHPREHLAQMSHPKLGTDARVLLSRHGLATPAAAGAYSIRTCSVA